MQDRSIQSPLSVPFSLRRDVKTMIVAFVALALTGCGGGGGGGGGFLKDLNLDGEIVILAFGNSVTRGVGDGSFETARPSVTVAGYPARLQALLGVTVLNAGNPGERTINGLPRLRERLQSNPNVDYVILLEGINDLIDGTPPDEIIGNLRGMIEVVFANGAFPILATMTPVCCSRVFSINPNDVAFVNDSIRTIALENGVELLDFFESFGGLAYDRNSGLLHSPEGLHPTPLGYDTLAALAADVLG